MQDDTDIISGTPTLIAGLFIFTVSPELTEKLHDLCFWSTVLSCIQELRVLGRKWNPVTQVMLISFKGNNKYL